MTTIKHGISPYSDGEGYELTAIVEVARDGRSMLELEQFHDASIRFELSKWEHMRDEIDKAVAAFNALIGEKP